MTENNFKFAILNYSDQLGAPAASRLQAFKHFFSNKGIVTNNINEADYLFISMPPFRNLSFFIKPKTNIILDIRDGWSIAQETGYGHTTRKKPWKAKITRLIEKFMIKRACITITCTNGLQEYLQEVSGKEVLLIPNGVLDDDYKYAKKLIDKKTYLDEKKELVFCCAGQFSEYGVDKVKKLSLTIIKRYRKNKIKIQLIGSNKEKNIWLDSFLKEQSNGRAYLEILPSLNRRRLYEIMAQADYGLTILRDPSYEFGTKVYDYIALNLPIVNYFAEPNNFTDYFDAYLDVPFKKKTPSLEIRRSKLISDVLNKVEFK